MTVPAAWQVLRRSAGSDLVLACDFAAAGRPIATFTELTGLLHGDYTVWETAPPPYGRETAMSGADHVERWLRDVRDSGRPVRAVLGFCSGGVYAAALADRISQRQRVPLILLDPEPADARMLLDFYNTLVTRRFAALLTPAAADRAVRAGREAAGTAGLMELAGRLTDLCREVVEPACAAAGLPAVRSAELVDLARSYLYWLAAAGSLDVRRAWATATAVNSSTPGAGLNRFAPAEREGLVARARWLDVSHAELMRSPVTARAVEDLLPEDGGPPEELVAELVCQWRASLASAGVNGVVITADSNFFVSGGHSLLALDLLARIEAVTGVGLRLGDLFGSPTPARLAARMLTAGYRPEKARNAL